MQDKSFEYGGHHFIPERQFTKREDDFFKITRRLKTDRELGFFAADYYGKGSQKFSYSYDDFYAASMDKKCPFFASIKVKSVSAGNRASPPPQLPRIAVI